ncbi:MAG: ATP-binding cassette domain-containing protein [Candidatus Moranbacteria bacterium]|nr:ATP-binding cassette domain-containing protein [Candidatus Moranbacteria bacterium]
MVKKNPFVNLFSKMWQFSRGSRKRVVVFIVFAMLANLVTLLQPIIIGRIFNNIQFSTSDPNLFDYIAKNLLLLLLLTLVFWLFHGTSRFLEQKNAFFVRKEYRQNLFDKLLDMPVKWHIDHHSGDTIDKIKKASESLFYFSGVLFMFIENIIRLIGSFVILTFYYQTAGLAAFITAVLVIVFIVQFDKYLIKGYKQVYRKENYLAAGIHDYLTNIVTVITLRVKKMASKEIKGRALKPYKRYRKNIIVNESKWFMVSMMIKILMVAVLLLNANFQLNQEGAIMIGTLFALYRYLESIGGTFFNFAWQYGELIEWNSAVEEAEVFNRDYNKLVQKKQKLILDNDWQEIEIKNLDFSYDEPEKRKKIKHLRNLNFKIKRGEKIALVGKSGSGKSTLLNLTRGLYEPKQAEFWVDGKKIANNLDYLRASTTMIPQDPEIFQNTIKYNINMGVEVKDDCLERAVKLACFEEVVQRLKKGLHTDVMEKGVSLSGGEKQRLALARGILAFMREKKEPNVIDSDSLILLMDEPTSSVDSANELKIYRNIFQEFSNNTILSSIHRLHLLEFFDYIYYFKQGKIVCKGDLKQVLKNPDFNKQWQAFKNKK